MISPTGKDIRISDKHGMGRYGASRGKKRHRGADYICEPGQSVLSPIAGIVRREARPYREGPYGGLVIENQFVAVKMFYLKPDLSLIGVSVKQGQEIGKAQDLRDKYPGITPHIHMEISSIDPEIFTEML